MSIAMTIETSLITVPVAYFVSKNIKSIKYPRIIAVISLIIWVYMLYKLREWVDASGNNNPTQQEIIALSGSAIILFTCCLIMTFYSLKYK